MILPIYIALLLEYEQVKVEIPLYRCCGNKTSAAGLKWVGRVRGGKQWRMALVIGDGSVDHKHGTGKDGAEKMLA